MRAGSNTLGKGFDPRSNSLSVMRLMLATLAAVHHAMAVGYGIEWGVGPAPVEGMARLGDFAVDAFFVLSGFLVTMSYLRLDSPSRHLWHRVLRIMPGFWACLVVTAVVIAPAVAALEGRDPWSVFPDSFRFVTRNALLLINEWGVAGLPAGTHAPGVINGALWTLFYEFLCYLAVAALGVSGILRQRRVLVVVVVAVWLVQALALTGVVGLPMRLMRRFLLLFLLGAAAYVYRHRLPITRGAAAGAAVVFVLAATMTADYRVWGGPAFAYLLLWAVVALPIRWEPSADLSYGIYVWHWPIETLLVLAGAAVWGTVPLIVVACALTASAAAVSCDGAH